MGIVTLLVASPALSRLLVYPQTEFFTEMWLLGPNLTAVGYPFNITRGQTYSLYLGLANHLGYSAYYVVEVKFRNTTQSEPTSFGWPSDMTPSSLPSLYNITAFVADEGIWELPLTLSFDYANLTISTMQMRSITLNSFVLGIKNCTMTWDLQTRGFFGYLFFETWIYNRTTSNFNYDDQFVSLRLNMTI